MKPCPHKACVHMFIATLLVIALNGKHPQYSLSGTRINDCTISICTVECHSAVEWVNYWFAQNCDEPLKHYPEQSKSPVRVYCAIPFTRNSITTQINPQWHKAAGVAGEGDWEWEGELTAGGSFEGDGSVLYLDCRTHAYVLYSFVKTHPFVKMVVFYCT